MMDFTSQEFLDLPATHGYKATNKDLTCLGFQFALGEWFAHEGDVAECKSGFHFCAHPSGPRCYYTEADARVFKCEAKEVLETPATPGADQKKVARYIRLTEEIIPGGNRNTGNRNTGDWNTGYGNTGYGNTGNRNTGNRNTGDSNTGSSNTGSSNTGSWNTGHWNTGSSNTGSSNTGHWNTGSSNTGSWNTGSWNTGDWNTGHWNTGNRNTGYGNTGDWNTGYGNATNHSSGSFCVIEPTKCCFDVDSGLSFHEFELKFGSLERRLGSALLEDVEIDFDTYKELPGITPEKLKILHEKHKAGRAKTVSGATTSG